MSQNNLQLQIFTFIAKITGHDVEDLEPDMYLESDMGLDSIKMVELLNTFIQMVPQEKQAEFLQVVPMEQLMQLQTLAEVLQLAQTWIAPQESVTSTLTVAISATTTVVSSQPETKAEEVPILDAQYIFLASHWAVSTCSLCSTLRLNGAFNPQVFRQSWQELLTRHPMLRAYFSIPAGSTSFKDYRLMVLDNPTPPEIAITDLRNCDRSTQEYRINEEVNRCINSRWDISQWPLHKFFVFQLEDAVYEVFFTNHHLISDGLSNQIVLRDFMEIYSARLNGTEPILPAAIAVADYQAIANTLNTWENQQAEQSLHKYLSKQGKDKSVWNPQGSTVKYNSTNIATLSYRLSRKVTDDLISRTRDWRLPLNSLVVGAYLRAAAKFCKLPDSAIINVPTSGRIYPGVDIPNEIGCFAQNLALSFRAPTADENWSNFLYGIHSEIHTTLAANHDNAQTRQMGIWLREKVALENGKIPPTAASLMQMGMKANLFLSNMGQTHIKPEYGSLKILNYRSATVTNAGTVDTLVEIFDNCLHLNTSYDSSFFSESLVDSFCKQLIANIEELASLQVQPQQTTQALSSLPTDNHIKSILQQIATEVCHNSITDTALDKDLVVDLGLDSLELIRIITKLEKQLGKVNRQALLSCRSLGEMLYTLSQGQAPAIVAATPQPIEIPYLEIIEQVKRTPDAVAIIDGNVKLTYQQLHRLSNQVANYLQTLGVKPGVLVGMMLNPGYLMWVGILGILKAGGAYVPLDPTYPHERIQYILEHAEVQTLLTEHQLNAKLTECLTAQLPLSTLVFLDEGEALSGTTLTQVNQSAWSGSSEQVPTSVNTPDDLMTVLYTSGSTGRPKGVMLNHRGYMNRLNWMQKAFQLSPGERVAQKTSCCFDISVWEIFWPLMVGATACPVKREVVRNPWSLVQWMHDTQINIMHFVPSLFGEFVTALEEEAWTFPHLRWLVFSGEALPVSFIQRWLDKYGTKVGLANLYGPTEASIDVTAHIIPDSVREETSIPIGKAIDNVNIVLLDEQMQPVQPGELGELWIGGVQLALGYLKNPEKTEQSFRPNPIADINSKYLYRTGDLAKQLPDGSFEYHGRIDHQVKIRGFRVELGEIENVLNTHPDIREAAVVAIDYESGQKKLVAGVVSQQVDNKQLKEYIGRWLPDYMIPHRIELLDSLPKNHNGKLDRKAIAAILNGETPCTDAINRVSTDEYLPLGPAQRWVMKYFEPPYQWTGYTRFLYRHPLELSVFHQAFNLLVERYSALRTVFVQKDGQWQQKVIQPTEPLKAVLYDGTHLTAQKRDEEVRNLIQQAGEQLQIDQWPLIKIIIVKVNDSCYDIAFIGHHLIGDLLSNGLVFQEFWFTYTQNLGNPNNINLTTTNKPAYNDYVRLLMEKEAQGDLDKHIYYWLYQFPSQKYAFQVPFDFEKGENIESSAAQKRFLLPKPQSEILLTKGKQYYVCNLYSLLLAPLYRLLAEWSGRNGVVLSHRSHGRDLGNNHRFFDSVGNFAVNFPMGITVEEKTRWEPIIKQIKQQFEWLPMNGVTFDWLSDKLPDYMYPDTHLTPVRANYLGNRTIPDSQVFEFIQEDWDRRLSPPQQKRTTLLEFFFTLANGCLEVEIEYSSNFHLPTTISQLGERYLELVNDMVAAVPVKSATNESKSHQSQLNSRNQNGRTASLQELTV
ncbi:non-ribosomal peptide synthetase [Halotia branconii]|uniref:Amino acid adenylation domain-containing protein n=1 Tax=Halotia branconii CENA392 TaxID=1539056 RepID=A0AAJ6P9U8_9CYAN|nr:non-ribosomal peptide synthetase [Halotia branconii]WGV26204.1 amino acid adenylation domain-containing protein [Halotia branconii CENA392]